MLINEEFLTLQYLVYTKYQGKLLNIETKCFIHQMPLFVQHLSSLLKKLQFSMHYLLDIGFN